ncbi:MAG: ATP-binding protein [Deltaproteobacteria bacterium]|nr:ATP-binding protein [Deltaproteobacteria bacterium]
MNTKKRYLTQCILEDLAEKMVFLGGPRQVGKTTLAVELIGSHIPYSYFNWDKPLERREALLGQWPSEKKLLILDEFHKHKKWKSWIKGEYDTQKQHHQFLLTGSARLDVYRRGGDSLQGRYHYWRIHPFSVAELHGVTSPLEPGDEPSFTAATAASAFDALLEFGGFPEPLIKQNTRHLRRWHHERSERVIKEDVRDLTLVQDIGNLSLLAHLLDDRAAGLLSINSLAEDLQVNFRTMANWIDIFERLYFCFRIASFQTRRIASVRKEKKIYLWDWSSIGNKAQRLENLVASHLLKYVHYLTDREGWKTELCYLRDTSGREVDFLICCNGKPWFAVEVKSQERNISPHLLYFQERMHIPFCYQVIDERNVDFIKNNIRVMSVEKFLTAFV